jgi:hypothetical protein
MQVFFSIITLCTGPQNSCCSGASSSNFCPTPLCSLHTPSQHIIIHHCCFSRNGPFSTLLCNLNYFLNKTHKNDLLWCFCWWEIDSYLVSTKCPEFIGRYGRLWSFSTEEFLVDRSLKCLIRSGTKIWSNTRRYWVVLTSFAITRLLLVSGC